MLELKFTHGHSCQHVRDELRQKLETLDRQIEDLKSFRSEVREALRPANAHWKSIRLRISVPSWDAHVKQKHQELTETAFFLPRTLQSALLDSREKQPSGEGISWHREDI